MWPQVFSAKAYDMSYVQPLASNFSKFTLGICVQALPPDFASRIVSGVRTSLLSQDSYLTLTFATAPGTIQRMDSFIQSSIGVSAQGPGRDLLVSY